MRFRTRWIGYVLIVLVLFGTLGVWSVQRSAQAQVESEAATSSWLTVLEVISLMKTRYVDDVDSIALISGYLETGTINGMLAEAVDDPYTRFMDVRAYEQMRIDTHGEYGGIGIMVGIRDERVTIIAPFDGTPGHEAGLTSGDVIVSIDGKSTEHMSLDEAVSMMRGPAGEGLILGIQRRGGDPFDVHIVRANIQVPSISKVELLTPGSLPELEHPVGYVRIQQFSDLTEQQLREALDQLDADGAQGLILDLRDNPGGSLYAAIGVANMFLADGPIMHIEERNRGRQSVHAVARGTRPYQPMVVLVNGYSASASEIVAGALKDRQRAVVVGMPTFGKGLVQSIIPLRDGSALSITSARYQTAGGHYIHEKGIEPDYVVTLSRLEDDWTGGSDDRSESGDPEAPIESSDEDAVEQGDEDSEALEEEQEVDYEEPLGPVDARPFSRDEQLLKALEVLSEMMDAAVERAD